MIAPYKSKRQLEVESVHLAKYARFLELQLKGVFLLADSIDTSIMVQGCEQMFDTIADIMDMTDQFKDIPDEKTRSRPSQPEGDLHVS